MSTTPYFLPDTGDRVTLHWNHWLPRLLMLLGGGSVNLCVTPSARHIYVAKDWIGRKTLAHECGHTKQARAKGWRYLPWVAWCFVRYGYATSPAEMGADAYMADHWLLYQNVGPVPSWVVEA